MRDSLSGPLMHNAMLFPSLEPAAPLRTLLEIALRHPDRCLGPLRTAASLRYFAWLLCVEDPTGLEAALASLEVARDSPLASPIRDMHGPWRASPVTPCGNTPPPQPRASPVTPATPPQPHRWTGTPKRARDDDLPRITSAPPAAALRVPARRRAPARPRPPQRAPGAIFHDFVVLHDSLGAFLPHFIRYDRDSGRFGICGMVFPGGEWHSGGLPTLLSSPAVHETLEAALDERDALLRDRCGFFEVRRLGSASLCPTGDELRARFPCSAR